MNSQKQAGFFGPPYS